MRYIYHGHMGGAYISSYEMDYDELYCDQCGDSDDLVMGVETYGDLIEAISFLSSEYYLSDEYLREFLADDFPEVEVIIPDSYQLPYRGIDSDTYYCTEFDGECRFIEEGEPQCHYCDTNFEYELYRLNKDNILHCNIIF